MSEEGTLLKGHRYRGKITVSGPRALFANNARVAEHLGDAGFADVEVWQRDDEDSDIYRARGTWTQDDVTGPLPDGVSDLVDITEAT